MKRTLPLSISFLIWAALVSQKQAVASSFQLSPQLVEHTSTSDQEELFVPFTIKNIGNKDITVEFFPRQIQSQKKDGTLLYAQTPDDQYKKLFDTIQFTYDDKQSSSITVAPQEKKEILLSATIPQNKNYYFSIFSITKANNYSFENSHSLVSSGLATHVLIQSTSQLPGSVAPAMRIPFLTTNNSVPIELTLANKGNSLIKTGGAIRITNLFDRQAGTIQLDPISIFPHSTRLAQSPTQKEPNALLSWNSGTRMGPYKATLVLREPKTNSLIQTTAYFLLLPIKVIILLTLLLFLLFFISFRVIKKLRNL